MRSWLIISFIFFVSCSPKILPPAESTDHVVEQANEIILTVENEPEENYKNVVHYLLSERGFRPHFVNASSLGIQTAYKPFGEIEGGDTYIRIHAFVRDNRIHFRGLISRNNSMEERIAQCKKGDLCQMAWQKLVEIAEGYSYMELYFSRSLGE